MKPVRVVNEPGFEKKAMTGPAVNMNQFLEAVKLDETIFGWKVDAMMLNTDGTATFILKREIRT